MNLVLRRYGDSPWGVFGLLEVEGQVFATVEPRWKGNAVGESCIPAGSYELKLRHSPVVMRTTEGRFTHGWEVTEVPNRTFIMFHPGNWARNSDGCILIGRRHLVVQDQPGVTMSQIAFAQFMEQLAAGSEPHDLHIFWNSTEYP